jgi:glutamate racemase
MNQQEETEKINPFPLDDSYQDKEMKMINPYKYEKIPIRIYGCKHFRLLAGEGRNMIGGISCGGELGTLEEGISKAIATYRQNSKVHMNGTPEDLFMLVYQKSCKNSIERQLGKYNNLERKVSDNHRDK